MRDTMSVSDYRRIRRAPRFTPGRGSINGDTVEFSDSYGFLHSVTEIFIDEVYRFYSDNPSPFIIDAGANDGVSILYFKRHFPNCSIIAYEPDATIFKVLERNVHALELNGVQLINAAVWVEDTELTFYSTGSLAGSTEVDFLSKGNASIVRAHRLKTILQNQKVNFLKIDIEGAENRVLFDIRAELENVERLFFEYHGQPEKEQLLGEMLNLVKSSGFRYIINGPHGPQFPFIDRIKRGFDLQLNVSCYRA